MSIEKDADLDPVRGDERFGAVVELVSTARDRRFEAFRAEAAVVTFLAQGIRTARWREAERSKRATRRAIAIWVGALLALAGLMVVYVLVIKPGG